jgi:hypothetical protein
MFIIKSVVTQISPFLEGERGLRGKNNKFGTCFSRKTWCDEGESAQALLKTNISESHDD